MASIDVDHLLEPFSDDDPSGPNLDEDPTYAGLEVAAKRKPETEVGGVVTPAEEPDWPGVQATAVELLERSKDLQVAIILTEALTHNEGLGGLNAGLQLVRGLLDSCWDDVHPALDDEDPDGAASLRIMRMKNLGDRGRTVRALRAAPLVESRFHGRFSLADLRAIESSNAEEGEDDASERRAALENAFQDAEPDALRQTLALTRSAATTLAAIEGIVDDKSDVREELGFDGLEETLGDMETLVEHHLSARGLSLEDDSDDPSEDADAAETQQEHSSDDADQPPAAPPDHSGGKQGSINSRNDAIRSLDRICSYFKQHEPSSPVPLLLQRAKYLIGRDFMEILEDMAPEGVSEAERIAGRAYDKSKDEDDDD